MRKCAPGNPKQRSMPGVTRWSVPLAWLLFHAGVVWAATAISAAESGFFLPQNPVAAAYVLGRLSNSELMAAPRSEFVYVALLERKGIDRKYRLEAADGLATLRKTDRLGEILRAITELDKKAGASDEVLADLGFLVLQSDPKTLQTRRETFKALAGSGTSRQTRQASLAALVIINGSIESAWKNAEATPAQATELVSAIPLIPDPSLRSQSYPKLKQLLQSGSEAELRRAAISSIVSIPGHAPETFKLLAGLAEQRVELPIVIASLARLPRDSWGSERLPQLADRVVEYLGKIPMEQRTANPFTEALSFCSEIASGLPAEARAKLNRTLRALGPTVITLHAVYEQMRFDKETIAVEAGRPIVITLQNDDAMPHNLAILAPGALQEIGLAAEKMTPTPDSQGRLYVPNSAKVLHATRLVTPGQQLQLAFDAPNESGDYPFVCTFPGHWLRMAGKLIVVPELEAYLATHSANQAPKLTEWKLEDFTADLSTSGSIGNAVSGQELFGRLACVQCHKLGTQGYAFGPELSDVFKRYNHDRSAVLQQILEPSKIIADRYRYFNFDLQNGDSVTGLILKEDEQAITVQSGPADSLVQTFKKAEVKRRYPQNSSPMPVGLLGSLSKSQIFDLLAFLESGGNPIPQEHHH
jgi:putative heme-binding domain-containing protein